MFILSIATVTYNSVSILRSSFVNIAFESLFYFHSISSILFDIFRNQSIASHIFYLDLIA